MSDEIKASGEIGKPGMVEFRVRHRLLPTSQHSNYMVLQGDLECVYIHFFQVRPPIVASMDEKGGALAEDGTPAFSTAEPTASVAISTHKLQHFIDVLNEHLSRIKVDQQ